MSYVQPDILSRIPIEGGELLVSPAYDVIHEFKPLGAYMLKYWNPENNGCSNVLLDRENATKLAAQTGLLIVQRPFIIASEHKIYLDWQVEQFDQVFGGYDNPNGM